MSEYPFNLRGTQEKWRGSGRKDDGIEKSNPFQLSQGIAIAKIEHHGYDDFKLNFVPTEGISDGEATAAGVATSLASGAATGLATGATIGSIIPIAGTIVGGVLGGVVGYFVGSKTIKAITPTIWTAAEYKGKFNTWAITQVKEDGENSLSPGKYCLEVKSEDRWTCDFIQPTLGQSYGTFDDNETDGDDGLYVWGPFMSGSRPLLATIHHQGGGVFFVAAYSVDGTHQCLVFQEEGQFHIEDHPTEIKPGKEYMLYILADGAWNLNFTEGY